MNRSGARGPQPPWQARSQRVCTPAKGRVLRGCAGRWPVGGGDRHRRGAAGQADRGDMKSSFKGMRALAAGAAAGAAVAFWGGSALAAADLIGQPTPGAIDLQPGVTPKRRLARDRGGSCGRTSQPERGRAPGERRCRFQRALRPYVMSHLSRWFRNEPIRLRRAATALASRFSARMHAREGPGSACSRGALACRRGRSPSARRSRPSRPRGHEVEL